MLGKPNAASKPSLMTAASKPSIGGVNNNIKLNVA